MIEPLVFVGNQRHHRAPIGFRIEDMHGRIVKPFSRGGVAEISIPGTFRGAVELPDDFAGLVIWGLPGGDDIAASTIEPRPSFDLSAITRRLDGLAMGLERAAMQQSAVGEMAVDRAETVAELLTSQAGDLAAIRAWCDTIAGYGRLSGEIGEMQTRLDRLFGGATRQASAPVAELANDERARYEEKISALQNKMVKVAGYLDKLLIQAELGGR